MKATEAKLLDFFKKSPFPSISAPLSRRWVAEINLGVMSEPTEQRSSCGHNSFHSKLKKSHECSISH